MQTTSRGWVASRAIKITFNFKAFSFSSHKNLFDVLSFNCTFTYRSTMTDKHNPTQQRQQPISLSDALFCLSSLGSPARSMPNSRRDPKEQRAFLRSILEQALEIANDVGDYFSEDSSSENADEEEENSSSQNQDQDQDQDQ
jgi:hypothetical protein